VTRYARLAAALAAAYVPVSAVAGPENLAPSAKVSASSEFSDQYVARLAVDGVIPKALSLVDVGQAWAVNGATYGGQAWFALEWDQPVTVAEVVYYGRTAFLLGECFRAYSLWADDAVEPIATGEFERGHGPQVIAFEPRQVRRLELRFTSFYGGPNAGAAEIQVYGEPVPREQLGKFLPDGWEAPDDSPELRRLVDERGLGFDALVLVERREMNPSHVYTAAIEGFAPGGGLYLLSPPTPDGELTRLVDSPEGQIMDCDVSYDGRQVIFSWRKDASDGYHIYRVNADGTELTQLTEGAWHDYNACWLPDGGIAFLTTRSLRVGLCFTTPSGILNRMNADGSDVRPLSANYVNDFSPSVLPDGRILYSRWEYVDRPAIPVQSLWTIHPDGTGLSVYYGNRVLSPASILEAKAVPGTTKILATLTAHNGPIRGALGLIDRELGENAQEAIVNLTPSVNIGHVDQGDGNSVQGPWESPQPIDPHHFLASAKGTIYLGDDQGRFAMVRRGGTPLGYYSPVPLRPRERPPVVSDTAIPEPSQPESATVFLLDAYAGLEPYVPRGSIKQLCVIEEMPKPHRIEALGFGFQRPVISCGATYAVKKVWGYVPVEADGSAHFTVPANRALYFEALDDHGRAVQRMRSFTHLAPGERQGCIGCHEARRTAPPVHSAAALEHAPDTPRPPSWGVSGFSYPDVVQPVLDRHCVRCHSGPTPPKRIDLTGDQTDWFSMSYDVLTHAYVSWIDTRNGQEANILRITPGEWGSPASKLTGILMSGHPDGQGQPRFAMSEEERRVILTWIDLNVPYYGTYDVDDPSLEGGRRIYPADLPQTVADVSARRCASCHSQGPPARDYVRITHPELNDFAVAPLAKAAGGRGSCGESVFTSTDDPDYRRLVAAFEPVTDRLARTPRMDMPGAKPAELDCSCL